MSYDERLADTLRALLSDESGLSEKPLFGGLAFFIGGRMAVAASRSGGLLLRVDPADAADLIRQPVAERMIMGGRTMAGWLHVDTESLSDDDLAGWVGRGVRYAHSLPPK